MKWVAAVFAIEYDYSPEMIDRALDYVLTQEGLKLSEGIGFSVIKKMQKIGSNILLINAAI